MNVVFVHRPAESLNMLSRRARNLNRRAETIVFTSDPVEALLVVQNQKPVLIITGEYVGDGTQRGVVFAQEAKMANAQALAFLFTGDVPADLYKHFACFDGAIPKNKPEDVDVALNFAIAALECESLKPLVALFPEIRFFNHERATP
jgi:hypothetical protein